MTVSDTFRNVSEEKKRNGYSNDDPVPGTTQKEKRRNGTETKTVAL